MLVDYEPLPVAASVEARWPTARRSCTPASEQRSERPDVQLRRPGGRPFRPVAAHVVRERFRHPRSSATPVECYGVIAHWQNGGADRLANFQGPFTLHSVAAAALGIPAPGCAADAVRERRLVRHQGAVLQRSC